MTTPPSANGVGNNKYSIPLLLALIAAGLAGNYFKFPIFFDIDFVFGSIFAMLALQFMGLGRGILAGAIIASYTYFLWHTPYTIIIMSAEVAVVGALMGRRKMGMVLADTLYWLIIGMPLVYLFYHVTAHLPFSNTYLIMTKQAVNGIANALVARLIFTGYVLRSRSPLASYSEIIYNLLAFFVLCPALILLAIASRTDFAETDRSIRTGLSQNSRLFDNRLEIWVINRKSTIVILAEMAASRSPQQMQPCLEQATKSDVNFLRIGLQDRQAISTAFYPLLDNMGQSSIGKNYADRPFITQLKRTLKPMLSEVVMGRIGIPKPWVMMLVPVVIRGEYGGYVAGTLSLQQLQAYLGMSSHQNSTLYTLLDKNGNVIMSNRADQKVMTPFVRGKGMLNRLDKEISQWVPVLPPAASNSERWRQSFYVAESTIGDLAEWRLILEQPVAPFQKMLYDEYTGKFSVLCLIFLLSLALAELLSRKIVVKLGQLGTITNELPVRLSKDVKEITWPESGIKEVNQLINNFKAMTDSLSEQFVEIRQVNKSLEQRVEERTDQLTKIMQELKESEQRYRTVADFTSGWEYWIMPDDTFRYISPSCEPISGYSPDEFYADPQLLTRIIHPDDLHLYAGHRHCLSSQNAPERLDYRIYTKNGECRWISHVCCRVYDTAGQPLGERASNIDITKRKQAEVEREQFFRFYMTSADLMCLADPNGAFKRTNPAFTETLGYSEAELVSKPFVDFVHPDDKQQTLDEMKRQLEIGHSLNFENRYICKDGSLRWLSWRASYNRDDHVTYATARDITERKRAEEALRESELKYRHLNETLEQRIKEAVDELREKEKMLIIQGRQAVMGEMIGNISHQWRQPLNMLGLLAQELAMIYKRGGFSAEYLDDNVKKTMELIQHMSKTIDDFRNFFQSDKEKVQFKVREVVEKTMSLLEGSFKSHGINSEIKETGDPSIKGYPNEFAQVLLNIVSNARDALSAQKIDSPTITFTLWAEGGKTVVTISDNAGGIPEGIIDRVFDPYFTTKGPDKGTGIGLYMSKTIIEEHMNGRLSVRNVGDGAEFRIEL